MFTITMSMIGSWYKSLGAKGKAATIVGVSLLGITGVAGASPRSQKAIPAATPAVVRSVQTESKTEKKNLEVKSQVDFTVVNKDDASLAKGSSNVTQTGVNGERTIVYEVTYTDGKETGRKQISDIVTKQAKDQIIANGTYVPPAPKPAPTPTPSTSGGRTGATCVDGSHSNATGRGACSHHGGVSEWLY